MILSAGAKEGDGGAQGHFVWLATAVDYEAYSILIHT